MRVGDILSELGRKWSTPRPASHRGKPIPFVLGCQFAPEGVSDDEMLVLDESIPRDLQDFWQACRSARLFEDIDYGQWGLELLSPSGAATETENFRDDRPDEHRQGDLVIGRFLGDSDLLILRCDRIEDDYGEVVVALPIDSRSNWYFLKARLSDFLNDYSMSEGDKFWEIGSR